MNRKAEEDLKTLALELKTKCDKMGREIELEKSAQIFHKLGLLHAQTPDKIPLIKSIGLLNSALARKPDNAYEIEKDLGDTCQRI